ncbi:MAG: hypothetical protein RLZZ44_589 [Bacteroidota bacterium]|jgi:hypothetical protein
MKQFKLENDPKMTTGFIVPDHYFDDFSKKLLLQLPEQKNNVIPIFQKRKNLFVAVAAALLISLALSVYNQLSVQSDELDSITLENHLTYQTDFNQYELISELDEKDLDKMESTIQLNDETIEAILTTNSDLERLITE